MPFATDRDLLILEPNLFRDIQWSAQRLVSATCSITGTTLTASGVDFAAQGVGDGHVALADGVPVEVIARLSATSLTVSRPRGSIADPATPPLPLTSKPLAIFTFLPQLNIVHEQILRMLGIDSADAPASGALTESAITNPRSLRLVEALGTLHLVLLGAAGIAAPPGPSSSALMSRADLYRQRFDQARRVAAARIDTNGDGVPDATRYLNALHLTRA